MGKITYLTNINFSDDNSSDSDDESKPNYDDINSSVDFVKYINDPLIPLDIHEQLISKYIDKYPDEITQLIAGTKHLFIQAPTKRCGTILLNICINQSVDIYLRIECINTLCNGKFSDIKDKAYDILNSICENLDDYPIPLVNKINSITFLMKSNRFVTECTQYFTRIINNNKVDDKFRYRSILSLENLYNCIHVDLYLENALQTFFNNTDNTLTNRILSGQYLLTKYKTDDKPLIDVQDKIYEISISSENSIKTRADAADVLLSYGNDNYKDLAKKVIYDIGSLGIQRGKNTIYNFAENVHNDSILKSVLEIIESLAEIPTHNHSLDEIDRFINESIQEEKYGANKSNANMIYAAMNRIYLDRSLYSKMSFSLQTILLKVWVFILKHEHAEELKKRLIEELVEASGKCSTGYAERLVNTLSGFSDFSIRISWEDQIVAKYSLEIFKLLKVHDKYDDIISEMTDEKLLDKPNYMEFMRTAYQKVYSILYDEFKEHITDTDFDLYMRKSLIKFEGQ